MKPSLVKAQIVVFAIASVAVILYAIFGLIGIRPFAGPFEVAVNLERAGGLFKGSEVTYRGVKVGNVDEVQLNPDGVVARMSIDHGTHVPADAQATVRRLSIAGEQYIDLTSTSGQRPYLASGAEIARARTATPPDFARVLADLSALNRSVDPNDLRTVTSELGAAFSNSGDDLTTIIDSSTVLVGELKDSDVKLSRLLKNSKTVLDTVGDHRSDIRSTAHDAPLFTQVLADRSAEISGILRHGLTAAQTANGVLKDNETSGPRLLEDLGSISAIQQGRLAAWKALLDAAETFTRDFPLVIRDHAIQTYLVFDYRQPACSLANAMTSPLSRDATPLQSKKCTNPATGTLLRGAQNAPK